LLTVVIALPQDGLWIHTGGGNIQPWHQYVFDRRWLYFPFFEFTKSEADGKFSSSSEKKELILEYDGRIRLLRIAGNDHAVRIGELILIQFGENWEPQVNLAKETVGSLPVSFNIGDEIERQLVNVINFMNPE